MTQPSTKRHHTHLWLTAATAAELMRPNPASVRDTATVDEAVAFLVQKGISAAPVIDEAGRPVGVLSRTDIIIHNRDQGARLLKPVPVNGDDELLSSFPEIVHTPAQAQEMDAALVLDLMTPCVFSVRPDAPTAQVIRDMVSWKVYRLFVVDDSGVLIGVISALDILGHVV